MEYFRDVSGVSKGSFRVPKESFLSVSGMFLGVLEICLEYLTEVLRIKRIFQECLRDLFIVTQENFKRILGMFIGVSEGCFEIILAILESTLRINNRVCVCWFVVQLSKVQKKFVRTSKRS